MTLTCAVNTFTTIDSYLSISNDYKQATVNDDLKMSNSGNIEENKTVNRSLVNIVDKDVQVMLLPLNMMQFISFSPKFCIKSNRITPNGYIIYFFSMTGALTFIFFNVLRTYMFCHHQDHLGFTTFVTATTFVDCIFYCVGFVINFSNGNIQSKNNIKFVLLFQRVHRLLNNETSFNRFIMWNWITVIVALGYHFIASSYFYIQLPIPWFYLFTLYFLVVFDCNVVYATRVMKLLGSKLELWNLQVLNSIDTEDRRSGDFSKRMFQTYVDVLECYDILKSCLQSLILYYIMEVFLHSLSYINTAIDILMVDLKDSQIHDSSLGMLFILSWVVKDLTWQTMFVQRCEAFYLAVQSAQDSCALILKSNCSDEEKKLYKNVLRLHRASFSKMRVCGLFYADAALQLSLMSLLANYTIVLLQFAFL